ncbi:MAG: alpha-ribazole phosphatase [Odoribacter sp.]|nr:alpha-ribazole phosphatase [Odoribacter sp.]MDY3032660.1 alpha-ribazole phosphatase [Odoribacter sp.]
MKLTFIRHTSVAVESGICYGWSDVDTASTFPQEAEQVRKSIEKEHFDIAYSSPLSRCRQLADFCGYTHPLIDKRLKELNFGTWEMQRWDTISDPHLNLWYKDWINEPAGGAESYMDQYQRVSNFLDEIRTLPQQQCCIFTHRGVIACALVYAKRCTIEKSFDEDIPYGSKTIIEL